MTSPAYRLEYYEPAHDSVGAADHDDLLDTDSFLDELFGRNPPRHLRLVTSGFESPVQPAPAPMWPEVDEVPQPAAHRPALNGRVRVASPASNPGLATRVAALIVITLAMVVMFFPSGVEAESDVATTVEYVVQEGDTLWQLAAEAMPAGGDIRTTIDAIKSMNDMTSSVLHPGDLIRVPAGT